jgi:hypothetical protein
MSFASDIEKYAKKTKSTVGQVARAVKIELFSGVVSDTRVDTGRLRGNWLIQENAPAEGTKDRVDPSGSIVSAEIAEQSTEDGVTYLVNNLPYAAVYEEKDGMVAKNMARIRRTVKEAARG